MLRLLSVALIPSLLLACVFATPASADTLILKDGRTVEGLLIADEHPEKGKGWYVVSRYGPTFVPAKDVVSRHEAKPADVQIKEYLAKLEPRDVKGRLRLARWMREIGREEEARALADEMLEWAPENAEVHTFLGHVRHRGRWVTPEEAKRAEGYVKRGGRWYTPKEWENLEAADKAKAEAAEKEAEKKRLQEDVNAAVRLALSPDPVVRERGKARLEALAKELDSEAVRKLIAGIDDYLETIEELRRKAAAAAAVRAEGGMVLGEIRATMTKLKRPIPVLQTNLASGPIGANAPVSIMLPELEVVKVRTMVGLPAAVSK